MHRSIVHRIGCLLVCILFITGCKQSQTKQAVTEEVSYPRYEESSVSLWDKPLDEVKRAVNGKWILVSGENSTMFFEFDDTEILFSGEDYSWTDEDGTEKGNLNWRKGPSGNGYDVYFTDIFYEENPTYLLAIKNDTLLIQDISQERYLYKLVRK